MLATEGTNSKPISHLAILGLFLSFFVTATAHTQSVNDGLPPISNIWTDAEKTDFKFCVTGIASTGENSLQIRSDFIACAFIEEGRHWLSIHPKADRKKDNPRRARKCKRQHAAEMKGTPEQFYAAFDLCMCKEFGLKTPKH
ncbi:MAG TPA: hypothetical protein VH079_12315 [Terriglobales bacterium]|jgi:hypothetical protein|nr:hypothetical protein [Terriglobales bacterium]